MTGPCHAGTDHQLLVRTPYCPNGRNYSGGAIDPTDVEPTPTVLICDDDGQFCSIVERLLTDSGWEIIAEVGAATAAIAVARSVHPDVVILDARLPGMSGIEAIADLRACGAAVVVCTAFASGVDGAITTGAAAVVDKTETSSLPAVLASIRLPA